MKCCAHPLLALLCAVLLIGCSAHNSRNIDTLRTDELNNQAHYWRYRNIDSTTHYAQLAYEEAEHYTHGRTTACNMLGFVAFERMDYEEALYWYKLANETSGCELERLVADVGSMNVYLRTADNLAFYDRKVRALKRLAHINEEVETFNPDEQKRLQSAVTELHMVSALHHYMIGQRPEAYAEMNLVMESEVLRADTAQWLMYLYLKGIGLPPEGDTREQRLLRRYTYLNNCLHTSSTMGYCYFAGLSSSGLSQLLADSARMNYIAQYRPNSFAELKAIYPEYETPSFSLATDALQRLTEYGDMYGAANATVQIASLYNRTGEYEIALDSLHTILDRIGTLPIPDALCHLYEEASLSYAGLGDKVASDHYRNLYLDLLETTRQDKELESNYLSLQRRSRMMGGLFLVVLTGIILFVVLLIYISHRRKKQGSGYEQQLRNHLQETEKRVYLHQRHIEHNKRDNVKRKASFSIVTGMMPYIDRMAHEVNRLQQPEIWDNEELRNRKLSYIAELTQEINGLNDILTHWIKGTQGMVGLHIESFALNEVFDMIKRSAATFAIKGITLEVVPTNEVVKADKALTFFMTNTLADNARKFTPEGGIVTIDTHTTDDYVEIAVSDTGWGMTAEDIARVLGEKVYNANAIGQQLTDEQRKKKGSGFGLLNCKGIIEKYRKTDEVFEVCQLGIDSQPGKGSRFWFRLPKSIRRLMAWLLIGMMPWTLEANTLAQSYDTLLVRAAAFADSVYYANVDGYYPEALRYADSAITYLNKHHRQYATTYIGELTATQGETDTETRWWLSDYATDYHTILDIRNEMAVANLSLRQWNEYRYNNRIYNDLYKLISEDRSLSTYCDEMQRYYSNTLVAVIVLVLLLIGYLSVILYTFMGRIGNAHRDIESVEEDERRAQHEANRLHVQNMMIDNCLSTIKHETIYYPNRIKQLVERLPQHDERKQMQELINYYKVVFTTLVNCASRQLGEVTFRHSSVSTGELITEAASYHAKRCRQYTDAPSLQTCRTEDTVVCDPHLTQYLLELLINACAPTDKLTLTASTDKDFVRFSLTNSSRTMKQEEIHSLFNPSTERITKDADNHIGGIEYIIARQIIREHDENFGHIGCRIKAESTDEGYTIWFTLPSGRNNEE